MSETVHFDLQDKGVKWCLNPSATLTIYVYMPYSYHVSSCVGANSRENKVVASLSISPTFYEGFGY